MDKDLIYIYKVKQGDITAFSYLINKYKDMAYNIAFQLTKNKEDSEEIAQDAFIKIYKSIGHFKGKSKFSTWLYSIVYNTSISKLRKKSLDTISIDSETTHSNIKEIADTQEQLLLLKEEEQKGYINIALNTLQEIDKIIVTLYYFESKTINEISELTKLGQSNVKIKLHRARKQMYSKLNLLLKEGVKSIL